MVAFVTVREKRIRIQAHEAIALCQCIDNAIYSMDVPEPIADTLNEVWLRLAKAFNLVVCEGCGCACEIDDQCDKEVDCVDGGPMG